MYVWIWKKKSYYLCYTFSDFSRELWVDSNWGRRQRTSAQHFIRFGPEMKIQFFEAEFICLVKSTFMENEVVDDFILSLEMKVTPQLLDTHWSRVCIKLASSSLSQILEHICKKLNRVLFLPCHVLNHLLSDAFSKIESYSLSLSTWNHAWHKVFSHMSHNLFARVKIY